MNISLRASLSLLIAIFLPLAPALAAKPYSQAELKKLWHKSGKRESKLITSNSAHFWAWSKNEASEYVDDYLAPKGLVLGDAHPRNVFDYRDGNKKATLAVADIDDGGEAPLFLDIVRYVTYLETIEQKIKIGEVFNAYVSGLRGEVSSFPAAMDNARSTSAKEIDAKHVKYIGKHTKNGKLDMADLELKPESALSREQRRELEELSALVLRRTGMKKILDVGYKENDSGSSADMSRYWFLLAESGETPALLIEFKQLPEAAVSYYQRQKSTDRRVEDILQYYSDNGLAADRFGVVSAGSKDFWMRPRHYQELDIADDDLGKKEYKEFAFYIANWMGLAHAKQKSGAALLRAIEKDDKAAKKALEAMVRAYLEEIRSF